MESIYYEHNLFSLPSYKKEHIANVNIKFKSHICQAFWCKINGIP